MKNWLIHQLGGVTPDELARERIAHIQAQAFMLDEHQRKVKDLNFHITCLQNQVYKLLIKEPKI